MRIIATLFLFAVIVPLLPAGGQDDLTRWQYRMKIAFPGYANSATLTNFPALVVLSPSIPSFDYSQFAAADASDLRFTDADGTQQLSYEIEDWHDSQSNSYVWVRVPSLNGPATHVWAYWGKKSAPAPTCRTDGSTWLEDFLGVWHFGPGESTVIHDSTPNGYYGDNYGSIGATGFIAKGRRFVASQVHRVILTTTPSSAFIPTGNAAISVSCWVKPQTVSALPYDDALVCLFADNALSFCPALGESSRVYLLAAFGGVDNTISVTNALAPPAKWTYITVEYDGRYYLSVDGHVQWWTEPLSHAAGSSAPPSFGSVATRPTGGGHFYDGLMDEIRISSRVRSGEWVWAEMMTMASNSVFTAYGPIDDRGPPGTILFVK